MNARFCISGTANPAILQAAEAVILDKASCYARESSGVYVTCTGGGWERGSSNCQVRTIQYDICFPNCCHIQSTYMNCDFKKITVRGLGPVR